jgi:hypothetical protein
MNVAGVTAATPASKTASSQATQTATQAKQVGLAFEQVLVNELAQQMAQTTSTPDDGSSSDGSDGSDGTTSGLMGSDPASSAYAQMIPSVLTSSIMSAGGTGIAQQIAQSIDPALMTDPALGGTPSLAPSLNLDSSLGTDSSLGGSL